MSTAILILSSFFASVFLTGVVRQIALATGLLDRPNARSSHTTPTPRGGGIAVVVVSLAAIAILGWSDSTVSGLARALLFGGPIVAVLGLLDDLRGVSVRLRLLVQFASMVLAVSQLGMVPELDFGFVRCANPLVNSTVGVITLVWFINLYNFMDGIDGIAGMEGASLAAAAACLIGVNGSAWAQAAPAAIICVCAAGFLCWNWPPARVFMGDVGSTFLGFAVATLAWWSVTEHKLTPWVWTILAATFIVDATATLAIRWGRGSNLAKAHRSHAYQRLSRRFGSHRTVSIGYLLVNVLWLDPLAYLALIQPRLGFGLTVVAWLPLVFVAIGCGAGRADEQELAS